MPPAKIQDLILEELREVRKDVKEVRERDIPQIKVDVAVISRQWGLIGSGIAIVITTLAPLFWREILALLKQ